jgi:uncharacterized membrane protein YhaH (DUF805 family)
MCPALSGGLSAICYPKPKEHGTGVVIFLLFSVRGRINRAQYWLGNFISGAVFAAGLIVAGFAASGAFDNAPKKEALSAGAGLFALLLLPLFAFVCWSAIAIQIKRFHDRGKSWWFVLLPFIPMVFMAMAAFEIVARGGSPYELAWSVQPYSLIGMLINLYVFVELGCLGSVEGENKFGPPAGTAPRGPDPRPSGAVDAASTLFGAQSAMDRAIADARTPQQAQPQSRPSVAPTPAPAFAAATARAPMQPATPSFGRRVTR